MRKFLIVVLGLFPVLLVQGQQRLLSIMDQQDLTLEQQVDSVIVEFGLDVKEQELSRLLGMLGRLGGKTRCVAVSYRTEDPKGGEVEASGKEPLRDSAYVYDRGHGSHAGIRGADPRQSRLWEDKPSPYSLSDE